jgi:cell division protein FtsI (penicillin-binding protein 3)
MSYLNGTPEFPSREQEGIQAGLGRPKMPNRRPGKDPHPFNHTLRLILIAAAIFAWSGVIFSRLVNLQWQRSEELSEKAQRQYQHRIVLNPKRGTIFDRHGRILAISVDAPSVYVVPEDVDDAHALAETLQPLLEKPAAELERLLQLDSSFVWLRRKITPELKDEIKSLELPGIHFVTESKRVYPAGRLAGHVIGFAGMDNDGLAGLEHKYDSYLRGRSGLMIGIRGAKRGYMFSAGKVVKAPTGGYDVRLTLDGAVQFVVEEELKAAVERTSSKSGIIVVMDPYTGAILAMATYPDFDPNDFAEASADALKNRAVINAYEPGSTFKIVTASAALRSGLVGMEQVFNCGNGRIDLNGHTIRDHKPFGDLSFRSIIENSSNIGAIKVGIRIGSNRLYEMASRFGYGTGTGIDLPAENPGVLRPVSRWSELSIGAISIGQEVSANPVQILLMAAAVANGGYRVRPFVVDSVVGPDGEVIYQADPWSEKILDDASIARLRELTAGVVLRGTGKQAAIPGVAVAGKTGTAEKADPRTGYIPGAYVASFIGYFPADEPRVAMICLLDEPVGEYYGGQVAAPLFSAVGSRILRAMEIMPAGQERIGMVPAAEVGTEHSLEEAGTPPVKRILRQPDQVLVMPDVRGMSLRDALLRLGELGVVPAVNGSGKVVGQSPAPGQPLGSEISLQCSGPKIANGTEHEAEDSASGRRTGGG